MSRGRTLLAAAALARRAPAQDATHAGQAVAAGDCIVYYLCMSNNKENTVKKHWMIIMLVAAGLAMPLACSDEKKSSRSDGDEDKSGGGLFGAPIDQDSANTKEQNPFKATGSDSPPVKSPERPTTPSITVNGDPAQRGDLKQFFPKMPGYEAEEIDANSMAGTSGGKKYSYTVLKQSFTDSKTDTTVDVTMMDSPDFVGTQKTVAESYRDNPYIATAMEQQGVKFKMIDRNGWTGWQTVAKDGDAMLVVFSGRVAMTIHAEKGNEALLGSFLSAIDLKGLAEAAK